MEQLAAILIFFVLETVGEMRLRLDSTESDGWLVWNQNKSVRVPAKVPGGVYTDLRNAKVLQEDLFYRFNDMEYRWVAQDNWFFSRKFDVPQQMLEKSVVNLVFHGIDTVGDVFLNGNPIGAVGNMFVRHVFPVKNLLKDKGNEVLVQLNSPIAEAEKLSKDQNRTYSIPPQCTPAYYNGECHVNFLRKMQASFSWDWGPAFPSVGIWKSVELEAFDRWVIRDVTARVSKANPTTWRIDALAYVEYAEDMQPGVVVATLSKGDRVLPIEITKRETRKDESSYVRKGHVYEIDVNVPENAVETWWPNGFGKQPLYDLTIALERPDHPERPTKTVKIGFRTVELVQDPIEDGKKGYTFYFRVNGIPIFAKGSNWIPAHILPELGYEEATVRHLLQSAKDANMNMLRVWGGGVYESDTFYGIADEMGILIWQDMMFACSMYPTDDAFLDSVKKETEQQVRRLQHHPSIALWAGNNENEVALVQNWYGTRKNFTVYKEDYIKLYVDTIKPVVAANDASRYYLTSSPSNGVESDREGHIASNPQSPLAGDVHHYEYVLDGWNSNIYPNARFASEYGFQGMPSYKAISEVTLPDDRKLHSTFTMKRQHHIVGNFAMLSLMQRNLPHFTADQSEEAYKTFIYYSQISQAMSIKAETEKYRRDRSKLTSKGEGKTMGAMYWQLNDVWQAPSWSSIEFGGRWKMLHYFAKKFFSPVLISPERTPNDDVNVFLVSDLLEKVPNVRLEVSVYSWNSFVPLHTYQYQETMEKETSYLHKTYNLSLLLREAKCQAQDCFIYFSVTGPNIFSDNFLFPTKLFQVTDLKAPTLSVKVSSTEKDTEAAVKVTTDRIAAFVWLETEEPGEFSDNGFLLIKPEVDLVFRGRNNRPVDVAKLKSTITVRSLVSTNASAITRHLSMAKTVTQGLSTLAVEGKEELPSMDTWRRMDTERLTNQIFKHFVKRKTKPAWFTKTEEKT